MERLDDLLAEPLLLTDDTWGTGPTAEAGAKAMEQLAGGTPDEGVWAAILAAGRPASEE